jgi:hypothetical protein
MQPEMIDDTHFLLSQQDLWRWCAVARHDADPDVRFAARVQISAFALLSKDPVIRETAHGMSRVLAQRAGGH